MGFMMRIDEKNIEEELKKSQKAAVLFYADWCPFCRAFKPKFEAYAKKTDIKLLEANISEESNPLWDKYGVNVVPTVVVFSKGKQLVRADGKAGVGLSESEMDALLKAATK
jgi:thiol-disulfide isomerase/thioredoxin